MNLPPLDHGFDYATNPDWVVLGLGGTFTIPEGHATDTEVMWRFANNPEWRYGSVANQRQSTITYAMPRRWRIVQDTPENRANVLAYNPPHVAAVALHGIQPTLMDETEEIEDEEVASTQEVFTPPAGSAKLWCLTFNGTPMGDGAEFMEAALPLMDGQDSGVIREVWMAQWQANADAALDSWMDREPVLVACCGYTAIAQPSGAVVTEVITPLEIAEQPVGALIVRAAAGALLSGGMSNHFSFNESGGLVINPENPPSLEQGYSMMGRVFSTEETGERLKNFSRWTQGALIAELQRFFGDDFQMDALCEATERTYNTLNACLKTHNLWAHRKREALSWTHHKEVEFSTLEEPDKEWVLDQSVRLSLTVAEQRKLQSYVRTYGSESFREEMPEDRQALFDRLDVRSVNRNYLFTLQGVQYEYRGPFEHIPNGASIIVNADTKQFLDREGRPMESRTWVPVGVEVPALRGHAATNAAGVREARETGGAPRRSRGGRTQQRGAATGPAVEPDLGVLEEAMNEHIRAHPEILPETLHGVLDTPGPIVEIQRLDPEVAATQPNVAPETNDASGYEYNDQFYNEAGARRLVEMTGYPRHMPPYLQELLDLARTEEHAPETLGPFHESGSAFQAFMEASDDFLAPF